MSEVDSEVVTVVPSDPIGVTGSSASTGGVAAASVSIVVMDQPTNLTLGLLGHEQPTAVSDYASRSPTAVPVVTSPSAPDQPIGVVHNESGPHAAGASISPVGSIPNGVPPLLESPRFKDPYATWTGGPEWENEETTTQRCPLPPLTKEQLNQIRAESIHHHSQTQQLLLVLLFASLTTLGLLYLSLFVISKATSDDLLAGVNTDLQTRATYFGLPAIASMLLSMLMYFGFRLIWKKKTWRVMQESQTEGLVRKVFDLMKRCFSKEKTQQPRQLRPAGQPIQPQQPQQYLPHQTPPQHLGQPMPYQVGNGAAHDLEHGVSSPPSAISPMPAPYHDPNSVPMNRLSLSPAPPPAAGSRPDPFADVFKTPNEQRMYFYHPSNLLKPSDVILMRQWPSYSQKLWAILFSYYSFALIPFILFGLAMAVFQNSDTVSSWGLSFFLAGCNFVSTQGIKLLARMPNECFGGRTISSSFGVQFNLNIFVALVAILNPLMIFVAHFTLVIVSGLRTETVQDEHANLQTLFDSVWQSYLITLVGDESFLCVNAYFRWKQMKKKDQDELEAANLHPVDAPRSDASGVPEHRDLASKARETLVETLMEFNLESELKLFLYAVMFPLVMATVSPTVIFVGFLSIPIVYIGFKIRYDLFHHLLNEQEENDQLKAAEELGGQETKNRFRRGSDLMTISSILSVLYLATQWVIMGASIVVVMLNLDAILSLYYDRPSASSSSSSTGSGGDDFSTGFNSFTGLSTNYSDIGRSLMATTSTSTSSYNSWSFSHRAGLAIPTINSYGFKSFDFSQTQFVGFTHLYQRFTTQYAHSSLSFAATSDLGDGDSSGSVVSTQTPIALAGWILLLAFLWVFRSWYFLCKHQVKAVRTKEWTWEEKARIYMAENHIQPQVPVYAYGSQPAQQTHPAFQSVAPYTVRQAPLPPLPSTPPSPVVSPVEDYITSELNPDKLSALAYSMCHTHPSCCWLFVWWCIIHLGMLIHILEIVGGGVGLFLAFQSACLNGCGSVDTPDGALCQQFCSSSGLTFMFMFSGLILSPLIIVPIAMIPNAFIYKVVFQWVHEVFLGLPSWDPIKRKALTYPGKFWSNPCWIWWKRASMIKRKFKQRKARIEELKRLYGDTLYRDYLDAEEKKVEEDQHMASLKAAGYAVSAQAGGQLFNSGGGFGGGLGGMGGNMNL